jgi:hypothetical protein
MQDEDRADPELSRSEKLKKANHKSGNPKHPMADSRAEAFILLSLFIVSLLTIIVIPGLQKKTWCVERQVY